MKLLVRGLWSVVFLLSLLIMLNWISEWTLLLVPLGGAPPMVFNAALGFFLITLGCFFPDFSLTRLSWIPVLALALIVGLEHLFHTSLGIDELFVPGLMWDQMTAPGRMAPAASLALFLLSLSRGAFFEHRKSKADSTLLLAWVCSWAVLLLGLSALASIFLPTALPSNLRDISVMSVLSATCCVCMGLGGILETASAPLWKAHRSIRAAGVYIGLVTVLMSFFNWEIQLGQNSSMISRQIQRDILANTAKLNSEFRSEIQKIRQMTVPRTPAEAEASRWKPASSQVQMVVRLGSSPQVIWSNLKAETPKEFQVLLSQTRTPKGQTLLENLVFQRQRWMAIKAKDHLFLFRPDSLILRLFNPADFQYSLYAGSEILYSNETRQDRIPPEWNHETLLEIEGATFKMVLHPTEKALQNLGLSNGMPSLLASLLLALAVGVIFHWLPSIRNRSSIDFKDLGR